ncbi:hypothetical protein [Maioricimonas sp. JC845]|uniref:hypothetical protein n=1 Tax=Maioricimonas sp. JC845 TaxID=3232138 RepID=UPI00345B3FD9
MAHLRQRSAWNHTAALLALIANAHRDPKKTRPFRPTDFHPLPEPRQRPRTIVPLTVLKDVFVDRPCVRRVR